MRFFDEITAGSPNRMTKPIALTLLSNVINVMPFALVIHAVHVLFRAHSKGGRQPGYPAALVDRWRARCLHGRRVLG